MCGSVFGSPKTTEKVSKSGTSQLTGYAPAMPGINTAIGQATEFGTDPTNFIATTSPQTREALGMGEAFARSPSALETNFGQVAQGGTQDYLTGAAGLRETATGDPMTNPYYQAMRAEAERKMRDQLNAQASGMGRFQAGSPFSAAYANAYNEGINRNLLGMDYAQFNDAMARRDAAQRGLYTGGAQLAGQSGLLDDATLRRVAAMDTAGTGYNRIGDEARTAPGEAAQWTLGLLQNPAQRFGLTQTTGKSKGTSETDTPIGNQVLGAAIAGGKMAMGIPTGEGSMWGTLFG